jgi:hypothetical protein
LPLTGQALLMFRFLIGNDRRKRGRQVKRRPCEAAYLNAV